MKGPIAALQAIEAEGADARIRQGAGDCVSAVTNPTDLDDLEMLVDLVGDQYYGGYNPIGRRLLARKAIRFVEDSEILDTLPTSGLDERLQSHILHFTAFLYYMTGDLSGARDLVYRQQQDYADVPEAMAQSQYLLGEIYARWDRLSDAASAHEDGADDYPESVFAAASLRRAGNLRFAIGTSTSVRECAILLIRLVEDYQGTPEADWAAERLNRDADLRYYLTAHQLGLLAQANRGELQWADTSAWMTTRLASYCGPQAVSEALAAFGQKVSAREAVSLVRPRGDGMSSFGALSVALRSRGLEVGAREIGLKQLPEYLRGDSLVIAHLGRHFAVVTDYDQSAGATLLGEGGPLLMPCAWFLREWDGYVLLVRKPGFPQPAQIAKADISETALEE